MFCDCRSKVAHDLDNSYSLGAQPTGLMPKMRSMPQSKKLPDFEHPPIIEALMGVQFTPLKGWGIPHYGMFWQRIRSDYPKTSLHQPIATSADHRKAKQGSVLELITTDKPPLRCWFVDEPESRLIQVQDTHFLHNWRKVSGMESYPRYMDSIRPTFELEWGRFNEFLKDEAVEKPDVVECEITYINHFEKGREWQEHADLGQMISCWSNDAEHNFLPPPKLGRLQLAFPISDDKGVLIVRLEPGVRNRDAKDILQLTVTAKGRPESSELPELMRWFDLAREWVVCGFTDLTTEQMHALWGRKQ